MASPHGRSQDPRLSMYMVLRGVGRGSYGEVFLARRRGEKKQYVMKNIKLSAATAKERLAAEQEASLLSQLQHPNIVSYRESFQDEFGTLHIVMGYCEGGDLHSRLKARKGELLAEPQVVEWFVQITLALQYLHDKNILHRDLKTQNIFLSRNDIIKVGDLGIARVLDGSCDLANTVIGTPYYMSPELFANKPYNNKSDIWALGCCVYEMATLKHAFTAQNINALMYKIIQGKVPVLPSQFSGELSSLVQAMMSQDASRRPSAQQILRMDFIRTHIKLFLDKASNRKRKSKVRLGERDDRGEVGRAGRRGSSGDGASRESSPCSKEGRSSSLTALPQVRPSKSDGRQRLSQEKKLPRPLPPDPTRVRSPLESKPPPSPAVSSARERRRKHKQEKGRRVVLRSRSSNDLQRDEPPSVHGSDESGGSNSSSPKFRQGTEETDGPITTNEQGLPPPVEQDKTPFADTSHTTITPVEGTSPSINGSSVPSSAKQDISNDVPEDGSNEVDEFYTLLDTTLHLPDPPSSHGAECPQAGVEDVTPAVPSGRLAERVAVLRRECERGVGLDMMSEIFTVLDRVEPDNAEVELVRLMGRDKFLNYGSKLQQLKLCEESLYGQ